MNQLGKELRIVKRKGEKDQYQAEDNSQFHAIPHDIPLHMILQQNGCTKIMASILIQPGI